MPEIISEMQVTRNRLGRRMLFSLFAFFSLIVNHFSMRGNARLDTIFKRIRKRTKEGAERGSICKVSLVRDLHVSEMGFSPLDCSICLEKIHAHSMMRSSWISLSSPTLSSTFL